MKHEGLIAGFQRTPVLNSRGDHRWRGLTQSSSQQMTPVLGDVSKWCPSTKGYISTQILYNGISETAPSYRQVTRQEKNHLKWHFTYPLGSVPREDVQKPVFLLRSPVLGCNRMSHLLNQTTHDSNSNLSKWHGSMVKCLPNAVGMSL